MAALASAAVLFLFLLMAAQPASAARVVDKNGRVHACFRTKAPRKGTVRLVSRKAKCHRGEKKIAWNTVGHSGQSITGEPGETPESGANGEAGGAGITALETRIQTLTKKVAGLEDVLKGVNNSTLTGALSKLQGISGTQLQEAIASIADANALCVQAKKLTEQSNLFGNALGGISLTGAAGPVLGVLGLAVPSVPALPAFGCP